MIVRHRMSPTSSLCVAYWTIPAWISSRRLGHRKLRICYRDCHIRPCVCVCVCALKCDLERRRCVAKTDGLTVWPI